MPQAKKGPDEVETATRNVLNPLDVMVITRERLQDTLDDAVRRGRMTRDDASDLLAEVAPPPARPARGSGAPRRAAAAVGEPPPAGAPPPGGGGGGGPPGAPRPPAFP